MLNKYRFEISNSIVINIEANSKEEARLFLVDNTGDYSSQMVDGTCIISDGEEIN